MSIPVLLSPPKISESLTLMAVLKFWADSITVIYAAVIY